MLIAQELDTFATAALQPPESIDDFIELQRWVKLHYKDPANLTVVRRIGTLTVGVQSVPKVTVQVG